MCNVVDSYVLINTSTNRRVLAPVVIQRMSDGHGGVKVSASLVRD